MEKMSQLSVISFAKQQLYLYFSSELKQFKGWHHTLGFFWFIEQCLAQSSYKN